VNLQVRGVGASDPAAVERLARRMVHPLCGLDTRAGFVLHGRPEPRFAVAGGQLTGVHRLLGHEEAGSYHIGGVGLTRAEALVRTLGESVERYCQLISVASGVAPVRVATVDALVEEGREVVDPRELSFFDDSQYDRPGFRFQRMDPSAPFGWVSMWRLPDKAPVLVPAQLALVGYNPRRGRGEPWLAPAVTTGTATHRTMAAARRGAMLELIQIDTAMGHWYGTAVAPRIVPGARLQALQRLLDRHLGGLAMASFHYLASPDLPAHTVVCGLRQPAERRPLAVVGLGCEVRLAEAGYKALLEAVGVLQLAKIAMASAAQDGTSVGVVQDETQIFDLDNNVGHYADGGGADILAAKFPTGQALAEADLPADLDGSTGEVVAELEGGLLAGGFRLFECDLTSVDVADLGLVTARIWSPDLLALAMPSAPPLAHARFAAHGGAGHERPHPYP
jgi:thiazole/oxazole-forming peptide maturase SagD family component